ncbi:MAG: Crp/Fnr family transcriptional regulator [Sphaerotilus sp.]|nr:Crp/Fnr family transcriptional regulator [Sphaerotilus sp.]
MHKLSAHYTPALLGLRPIRLLAGLSDDTLTDIAQAAQFKRYRRGQTILTREDQERDLCLISAGHVRVILLSPSGREVRFRDIPCGGSFGEIAALDGRPRCATVLALEDTLLVRIAPEALGPLLQRHWPMCERLLCGLASSLRHLTERVYELSAMSVQQRLIAELLRQARPAHDGDARALLDPAPRHADLAAAIGTSREQVSRELAALAREGLVLREDECLRLPDVFRLSDRLDGLTD